MQLSRASSPQAGWVPVGARRCAGWLIQGRVQVLLRAVVILLPTLVGAAYYGVLATDRYVSEARFVIRTASKPTNMLGGLNALLQLAGLSRSQDDAYAVRDFLTSREVLQQLAARVDLRAMYQHTDVDLLVRYPSLLFRPTEEGFFRYFQNRLSVVVNNSTGLTTLKVEAFRADDAFLIARALLELGEGLVNKLNTRLQDDAVRVAAAEVARGEERRVDSQVALTAFRNRELILDPAKSSAIVLELIGRLSALLAEVRTQIAETEGNSRNSPQLQTLRLRAAALERQIGLERGRVANSSDGLAEKIAEYERLILGQEFSVRSLAQSVAVLEMARVDARRQQLFLERVVEPGVPDEAIMPRRWRMALTIFGFNVIGAGVLWLLIAGLREHAGMGTRRLERA